MVSRLAPRSMSMFGPVRLMPRPSMWAGSPLTVTLACGELGCVACSHWPVISSGRSLGFSVWVSCSFTLSTTVVSVSSPGCWSRRSTRARSKRPLISTWLCWPPAAGSGVPNGKSGEAGGTEGVGEASVNGTFGAGPPAGATPAASFIGPSPGSSPTMGTLGATGAADCEPDFQFLHLAGEPR